MLELEITESYENELVDVDWHYFFQDFVGEFSEQVEYAVESDARSQNYTLKDFFLETLESHGCIPIAFKLTAPFEMSYIGKTSLIEEIRVEIKAETENLLKKFLNPDSTIQAAEITHEGSSAAIPQWAKRWEHDVEEIVRRCLSEVLTNCCPVSSPADTAAEDRNFGGFLRATTRSSDPRNAFFAVLRQAVKAATGQFLTRSPAIQILDAQRDTFRDSSESALRKGLADRAQKIFHFQPLSSEANCNTYFSMLWHLAWPARFPEGLEDLMAEQVVNFVSDDLKEAAKMGFIAAFESQCQPGSSCGASNLAEELAENVFEASSLSNLFPNWIFSGWIDLPIDNDVSNDGGEPIHTKLIDDAKLCTLGAMQNIYDNYAGGTAHDSAIQALKRTFKCRKELHNEIMSRLNQPDLTDRTGMGAFFVKMNCDDCDKALRLAYSVLKDGSLTDQVALERLAGIEDMWALHGEH